MVRAEAAGELRARYRYLYAAPEGLTVRDVAQLLAAYKELVLRHEMLAQVGVWVNTGCGLAEGGGGERCWRHTRAPGVRRYTMLTQAGVWARKQQWCAAV